MADLAFGRLGYGTANVGNLFDSVTDEKAWQLLETAWDCGIRYFDTAPHYGLGLAERRLGAFLSTKPRDEFIISTKVGRLLRPDPSGARRLDTAHNFAVRAALTRIWDFTADGVRRSLEESLDRLGLDAVDVVYLHDPERFDLRRGVEEGLSAMSGLRDEGLVRAVGVGSMSLEALLATVRSGMLDLLMVAGRFTLADQSVAGEVLPECRARDVGIVDAAVFNSGLLASGSPTAVSRFDYAPVSRDMLFHVRRIAEVCGEFDVSLPLAALHYPFREGLVRSVVVGGATSDQIRENARNLQAEVPDELWLRLREEGLVAV